MKRVEALARIAELHEDWSIEWGDTIEAPSDLADLEWSAEAGAAAEQQDALNQKIVEILAQIDGEEEVAGAEESPDTVKYFGLTAAAARVHGLSEVDRLLAEERLEVAVLAALEAVAEQVAGRIGQVQTAAGTVAFHLPGKHDQRDHARKKGGAPKSAAPKNTAAAPAGGGGGGGRVDDLPRSRRKPSVSTAAKGTNPNYGETSDGPTYRDAGRAGERWTEDMGPLPNGAYEENCTNTVMAFEMRMRGYEVEAAPLDVLDRHGYASGRTIQEMDDLVGGSWSLPGGKPHGRSFRGQEWRTMDQINAEVESWPDGGRGFMTVGRHVFSVTKKDGKAQYVEPQFDASPSRTVTRQYRTKYGGDGRYGVAKLIRLDDLEPTDGIFESISVPG